MMQMLVPFLPARPVQAVAERFQLIVVNDAYQRMQFWCINKSCIVVRTVNSQNPFHSDGKDT